MLNKPTLRLENMGFDTANKGPIKGLTRHAMTVATRGDLVVCLESSGDYYAYRDGLAIMSGCCLDDECSELFAILNGDVDPKLKAKTIKSQKINQILKFI